MANKIDPKTGKTWDQLLAENPSLVDDPSSFNTTPKTEMQPGILSAMTTAKNPIYNGDPNNPVPGFNDGMHAFSSLSQDPNFYAPQRDQAWYLRNGLTADEYNSANASGNLPAMAGAAGTGMVRRGNGKEYGDKNAPLPNSGWKNELHADADGNLVWGQTDVADQIGDGKFWRQPAFGKYAAVVAALLGGYGAAGGEFSGFGAAGAGEGGGLLGGLGGGSELGGTVGGLGGSMSGGATGLAELGAAGDLSSAIGGIGAAGGLGGGVAGGVLEGAAGGGLLSGAGSGIGGGATSPSNPSSPSSPSSPGSSGSPTPTTRTPDGKGFLDQYGKLIISGAGALAGAVGGGSGGASGSTTSSTGQVIDPRMDNILYGQNGLLGKVVGAGSQGQNPGMQIFGNGMDAYLGNGGREQYQNNVNTANSLMSSNIGSPQVNAPGQNNLDLSKAYADTIYGDPAQNPYLTGAIGKGINQSNNAFQNMQIDATRNLTENILPSIRSGAQANGQYGGSRQSLTEGRALNDFTTNMSRAASQYGQNNTDAAVSAQAGAYDAGKGRALSALSGLNSSQYGVASQNANLLADTNRLNSQNRTAGLGAASGLLDQSYGFANNQDQYGLNKLGKTAGILSPFTGLGSTQTSNQPYYQNKTGNILGGITAGLGLWNAYNKSNSGANAADTATNYLF